MSEQEIRWVQRYRHFLRALSQLEKAVQLANGRPLTELEEQGLIQAFEYTHELAWNVLKDFLKDRGLGDLYGSRDSTREAFRHGLIENGEAWMDMIRSQNLPSIRLIRTLPAILRKGSSPAILQNSAACAKL